MTDHPITMRIGTTFCELHERTTEIELPDGRPGVGYYQLSNAPPDGCMQAALATLVQLPLEEVGHVATLRDLRAFAEERGLRAWFHALWPPTHLPMWIGFTPPVVGDAGYGRHCVVGTFDRLLFDPSSGWICDFGERPVEVAEIEFAITLRERAAPADEVGIAMPLEERP